jgi:TolA-binding protein
MTGGAAPRAFAQDPAPASEQLEFADGLFARGLHDMALAEYQKLEQEADPGLPRDAILLRLGECHRHLGDKAAAAAAYTRLIETFPESTYRFRAEFRRAELYVAAGRYEEAIELFGDLLEQQPPEETGASAAYFRAYCYDKLGQAEAALDGYREVVRDHAEAPYAGYACLAAAALLGEDGAEGAEAMDLLGKAAAAPPSDRVAAEALFLLGSTAYGRGAYDRSADAFADLLTNHPDDRRVSEARLKAGWAYERAGRHRDALDLAQAALASGGDEHEAEWLYLMANCQRHLGALDDAAVTYDDLLSRFPESSLAAAAGYERVLVAYSRGEHEVALRYGQGLATVPGAEEELPWILAESAEAVGKMAEATNYYDRIVRRFPESERAPVALFRRARLTEDAGDTRAAADQYRSLARSYPNHQLAPEALAASGSLHASSERLGEALEDWRLLLERHPDFERAEEILFQKGLAEIRSGQPNQGMASLESLVQRYPDGPSYAEAQYWLGVLYSDAGRLEEAEAALREAQSMLAGEPLGLRARYRLTSILQQRGQEAAAADELQALLNTPVVKEMPVSLLEWLARYRAEASPHDPRQALGAARALLQVADEPVWKQLGWFYAGEANLAGGQRDAAIEAYSMAFDEAAQTPEQVQAALRLGQFALEDQRYDDAEARFRAAGEKASDPELVEVRARSYFGLAEVAKARGDREEAVRRYLSVSILFDDAELTPHALYEAVGLLEALGRRSDRARAAAELKARFPESPWTAKLLAPE